MPARLVGTGRKQGLAVIRILVVDDNPLVRRHLKRVLEQHQDWQVCDEAGDGQEAVERLSASHPDLVVLDFQMPRMTGIEAAREIRRLSPKMLILMVTLYLSHQLSDEARKAGIAGACAKTDLGSIVDGAEALLRHETFFPN